MDNSKFCHYKETEIAIMRVMMRTVKEVNVQGSICVATWHSNDI